MNIVFERVPLMGRVYRFCKKAISKKQLKGIDAESIFTDIFINNWWGDGESVSGPGSNLGQTKVLRTEIEKLFRKMEINTVLDIPCGDFYWMKSVNLNYAKYIGADIVKPLIEKNIEEYACKNISFRQLDIIIDDLPKVDLIICRDCFVHFSSKDVLSSLKNICSSKSTYLLSTSFVDQKHNKEILTGQWRPINLMRPPFNLPKPISVINEGYLHQNEKYKDKSLAIWRIEDISQYIKKALF